METLWFLYLSCGDTLKKCSVISIEVAQTHRVQAVRLDQYSVHDAIKKLAEIEINYKYSRFVKYPVFYISA